MSGASPRTRLVLRVGVIGSVVVLSGAGVLLQGAGAAVSYTANATSAAMRTDVRDPKIVPILEGGGAESTSPTAQASADSLGQSRGLAAVVFPGNDASGATDIPLTVIADPSNRRPPAMTSGGYQLVASAPEGEAHASANGGLDGAVTPAGSVAAKADVAPSKSGGVTAQASDVTTGLTFMTVLKLGTVTSRATAERSKTGVLKRSSDFTITGASLLGLPLEIVNGELVVPALGTKVPVGQAIKDSPALAAAKDRGLSLSFQAAQETPSGVIAPGIEVTMVTETPAVPVPTLPLPDAVPVGVGALPPSTVTSVVSIGFARASSDLKPLADFPADTVSAPSVGTTDGGSVGSVDTPSGLGSGSTESFSGTTTDAGGTPDVALPDASGASAPELAQAPAGVAFAAGSTRLVTPFRGAEIYLAIVAAAIVMTAAGQLIRYQGVKTR